MIRQRPNGLRIDRLTDDYLNVSYTTHLFPEHYEAPALYKQDGVYFMFGSQLTGPPIPVPSVPHSRLTSRRMVYVATEEREPDTRLTAMDSCQR